MIRSASGSTEPRQLDVVWQYGLRVGAAPRRRGRARRRASTAVDAELVLEVDDAVVAEVARARIDSWPRPKAAKCERVTDGRRPRADGRRSRRALPRRCAGHDTGPGRARRRATTGCARRRGRGLRLAVRSRCARPASEGSAQSVRRCGGRGGAEVVAEPLAADLLAEGTCGVAGNGGVSAGPHGGGTRKAEERSHLPEEVTARPSTARISSPPSACSRTTSSSPASTMNTRLTRVALTEDCFSCCEFYG